METRQEIQDMRVVDLRDFLRRHNRRVGTVMGAAGTPRQMRKSELLESALQVWEEHMAGTLRPDQSPAASASPPNPFQSGMPSPAEPGSQRRCLTLDNEPIPMMYETTEDPTARPPIAKEKPSAPPKARRRSAAWVDPTLLAQMQTPSSTKPSSSKRMSSANSAVQSQDRPVRKLAVRKEAVVPSPPVRRLATRPEYSPTNDPPHLSSASHRVTNEDAPSSKMPSAIVSIPLDDTEVPDIIEVTPTHPTIPRRGTGRSTRRPSAAQAPRERSKASTDSRPDRFRDTEQKKDVRAVFARPILDVIDEDYISEDDPDYTADVDDDDLANDDVFDGEADDGFGNHATDAHLQATRGPSESAPFVVSDYKIANVVSTQDEDVLIDSDFVESENLGESDPGSTVETEEEGGEDEDFSSWRVVDIRQWLRSQRVPFNPGGRKVELVSIARARKLEIEARGGEQYDEDDEDDEDDAIAPNRPSRQELHSRGRISAPSMSDDDDGAGHSRPIQRRLPGRQHTATRDNGLFGFNGTQKRRRDPLANRRVSAIITVFLLGSFLLCSAVFAISMLHQLLVMPYCDTGSMTSASKDGLKCQTCPRFGNCENGNLFCDYGFVVVRDKCVEDQEFSLFSEQLANDAFDALSQRAGDAECDHSISRFVHRDDLKLALRKLYEDRKEKASWFSRRTFDLEKLDGAMTKALEKLDQEESFDVTILESGEMCSNKPKLSLQCALKRKLLEHWRWVFGSFLVSIALMYMRVKLYFIKQHDLRLEEAHTLTLGFLREQLAGYRDKEEEFAFISDVVLREEVVGRPTPKNIKFWKEVEERLKKDPRLVRKQQSVKGMPSYTYEYIGSRRSSGGILDRRSSFGSRASLDSLDFRPSISPVRPQRRQPILDFLGRLFGRDRE